MGNETTESKPTSFLPVKAQLEVVKPTKATMEGIHIEAIHVVMFFGILAFLFLGVWKKSNR
jgi:hypothetical protein